MSIKAILFDLDETLVVEQDSDTAAFISVCELAHQKHGVQIESFKKSVYKTAMKFWDNSPVINYCNAIGIGFVEGLWGRFLGDEPNLKKLRQWVPTYQRETWAGALAEHRIFDSDLIEDLTMAFYQKRRKKHLLYDDAIPILKKLGGKFRLGIITNGAPDVQVEKIIQTNLSNFFDSIIISGQIGVGKPGSLPFEMALSQLVVTPDATLMVGDSIEHDILGAKQLGIRTAWLNRREQRHRNSMIANYEIKNLYDLEKKLLRFR
ncbi:MAG: hypothetical protein B6244_08060 [Candidatus Cloacimonetes bacterium 4572_55]|nr:MAG: hypothetical protein B6244_08060 [Candidatus Cloacimonetes bacterium 4572_55]